MPGLTSGLQRDINLVRRRAWLFIPFLFVGILAALFIGRLAGNANAVATMQLETVVNDASIGGDRGLRIFEAQSMTSDVEFQAMVLEAIGDPEFDYARFSISLFPISIADGVARGILTMSISDASKAESERLRDAWVAVFAREYTEPDGLFRTRFIRTKQAVLDLADSQYNDSVAALRALPAAEGLPLDEIVRTPGLVGSLVAELNVQEARIRAEGAEVQAALASPPVSGIQASAVLGFAVSDAEAGPALRDRARVLDGALQALASRRLSLSDSSLPPDVLDAVLQVRSFNALRNDAQLRLNNAGIAVASSQSSIETSYTSSGGIAGTLFGRIAVVVAVTLVFGLIAIYVFEWLAQVRAGSPAADS
ncbi:MAG: hypothetical protein R3B97_10460 [Dehalococcoidia bacterium]|nr:hypothetical protein [Dehalococcoidia bacterium]MCB9484947.1 hypothetical protein [Thermoflexaceae bacterium]